VMVYAPTLLVVALRIWPLASFLADTMAPGTTAPLGSVTVPESDEVSDWASAHGPVTTRGTVGRSAANRRALLADRRGNMGELRTASNFWCVSLSRRKIWERYHDSPF
jgi:hypothetical protein